MAIAAAKAAFEAGGGAHATHEANGGEIVRSSSSLLFSLPLALALFIVR